MHRLLSKSSFFRAPQHAGAFLFLFFSLLLSGCGDKEEFSDWERTENPPPEESELSTTSEHESESAALATPAPETTSAPPDGKDNQRSTRLRFLSYNVRNYLTMSRFVDGERKDRRKPAREVEALVRIIVEAHPDVLGICEIGTAKDLAELKEKLSEAGLALKYSEHAGGADETRRLALLSRYPIVAVNSQGADGSLVYQSVDTDNNPKEFAMQRGILDATIEAGTRRIRFLGVHLKSKRETPEGHQDLMRRHEAYLLRKHADRILQERPGTLLCVYGDLNETRRESPVRSIQGPTQSTRYLEPLSHKDSRGEVWTHYWDYQHLYSRFDYVLASRSLRPLFNQKASHIIDDPRWSVASDHRALLSIFDLEK
jgi:endonuclease/exonuclease/phosphatase family metal-dependent hydrolase